MKRNWQYFVSKIWSFASQVEQCVHNRSNFNGEELNLYTQHLNQLQKLYAELLSTSTKRYVGTNCFVLNILIR